MNFDLFPQCKQQCAPALEMCPGNRTAAKGAAAAPPPVAKGTGGNKPFLRTIPDACDLMDERSAMTLLSAAEIEPAGPRETIPTVTSDCGYRSVANRTTSIELTMLFMALVMADSYTMPREELRVKAGGFALLTGAQLNDVEGVGNIAFAVLGENYLTLKVYTGIYGTAEGSDRFTSELVLTYKLTNSELSPPDQMKLLYDASRAHMEILKKRATSTHEGAL
jgi:hypothetical protein